MAAWPESFHSISLTGSRVQSALVDLWGTARIGLAPGQTAKYALGRIPEIESALGARRGSVRIHSARRGQRFRRQERRRTRYRARGNNRPLPSKALTFAQANAVLQAAESSALYAYVVLSPMPGVRTEEARALQWDHVVAWVKKLRLPARRRSRIRLPAIRHLRLARRPHRGRHQDLHLPHPRGPHPGRDRATTPVSTSRRSPISSATPTFASQSPPTVSSSARRSRKRRGKERDLRSTGTVRLRGPTTLKDRKGPENLRDPVHLRISGGRYRD